MRLKTAAIFILNVWT